MFGLIYTIFVSMGLFFNSIKENRENENSKIIYKHHDGMTYLDKNGRNRLLSNDELVFYTHDNNGDYILEDACGKVYKNFSEKKRNDELEKRKEKSLKNSETTYCIDEDSHKKDWNCKGKRFADFKTGDIYVIRYINYKYYYMNISNGMLVRKTDWQIKQDELKKDTKTYLNDKLNIEEFNKNQMNIQNKSVLFRNFDYNSSCDRYK